MKLLAIFLALSILCLWISKVTSKPSHHRYKAGDPVPIFAASTGPYRNPTESYDFYSLPFCPPAANVTKGKKESLMGILNGDRLVNAPYKLNFQVNRSKELLCKKKLTESELKLLRKAISQDYFFEMIYDDLPIWGFVGFREEYGKAKYFLYQNFKFQIYYNNGSVIEVRLYTNDNVDVTEDKETEVEFSYSVEWMLTSTPFEKRMDIYIYYSLESNLRKARVYPVLNSSATILLIIGLLVMVLLRILKNDLVKYTQDEESSSNQEVTGWKNIHGDVFRHPQNDLLFAACLGCGTQIFILTVFTIVLGLCGAFAPFNRGSVIAAMALLYTLTSALAGYTAMSFSNRVEGINGVKRMLLTGCLFVLPLFSTFCFLNTIAIKYNANVAISSSTILSIVISWMLVVCPLLLFGGLVGKKWKVQFQAPCRTNSIPREIPKLRWHRQAFPQMAIAGILPFCSIWIELYYVFDSVWGYRLYTMYGILPAVFVILILVTASVTVSLTYFQLAAEDHNWWWRSFLCGGSTSLYMYGYCIYYYCFRTGMSGLLQTSFFFGYMACICYGFFLMLGSIGFYASLVFVHRIYKFIKLD